MGITKTFFFAVNFLAVSSICLAQATIFHDIAQGNKKAVKVWLKSNPDLLIMNDQGQTVLHAAVQSGNRNIVKMLTKAGVELNILDKQGKTALDHAVEVGHVKISYDLVKKKALIACAYNEKPLKELIIKRMMRLYKIFVGVIVVGAIIVLTAVSLFVTNIVSEWSSGIIVLAFMGLPGLTIGSVGIFGIAGLGVTSGIRTHRSYLMNQNIQCLTLGV